MKISVIVTTYNRPDALAAVLRGLATQDAADFEVIIADDGSTTETKQLLEDLTPLLPFSLQHIWQPDEGFRAAKIRNQAVASAKGDYLIFMDGDCIPSVAFIHYHRLLAEKNFFVVGSRILLNREFTQQVLTQQLPVHTWRWPQWLHARWLKRCNRWLPTIIIPWLPRKFRTSRWQGAKTCNLAIWREDFIAINGFDEAFQGWGYEDSDLIIRLLRNKVQRKEGFFALPVIHLWHPENDRSQEQANFQRLHKRLNEVNDKPCLFELCHEKPKL